MNARLVLMSTALFALTGCSPHQPGVRPSPPVSTSAPITSVSVPNLKAAQPAAGPSFSELNLATLDERTPVLTYHDVIGSRRQKDAVWFDCTVSEFEAQMKFLYQQGAHVITLEQLRRHLTTGERLPDRAIALTFDDNYQGVYDLAVPLLKKYGYPFAVFVHTDYVGSRKGRPKMTWAELRELDQGGLATIGAHTMSHTADLGLLPTARQDAELRGSKSALEARLGHPVTFLSYPNGKANASAFERSRLAGYTLGFMEKWGPVEQSPGILALNRYIHIQLPRAWAETYGPAPLPEARTVTLTPPTPVTTGHTVAAGLRLTVRLGGRMVAQPADAQAAVNSTGLSTASPDVLPVPLVTRTADGVLNGPWKVQDSAFVPAVDPARLAGRPLVLWNRERLTVLPFVSERMNAALQLQAFMPELQGAFVAEAWLVQEGRALSGEEIRRASSTAISTRRSQVFLGVTRSGVLFLGRSTVTVDAERLARAAQAAGAQEAVLIF